VLFRSDLLAAIAEALKKSRQVELMLRWVKGILRCHGRRLMKDAAAIPAAHRLQKAIVTRVDTVKAAARANLDLMNFLCAQPNPE
jgi:hypothetical protein